MIGDRSCNHALAIIIADRPYTLWCRQCGALGQPVTQPMIDAISLAFVELQVGRDGAYPPIGWYHPTDHGPTTPVDIRDMKMAYGAPLYSAPE